MVLKGAYMPGLEKINLPGTSSDAAKRLIGAENNPPKAGVFLEGKKYYSYKMIDGEWKKKQTSKEGNFLGKKNIEKKNKKVQLSFAVSPELKTEIESYCKNINNSVSTIVRLAIIDYMSGAYSVLRELLPTIKDYCGMKEEDAETDIVLKNIIRAALIEYMANHPDYKI